VGLLQSFALGGSIVIYVRTYESDDVFLFFSADPVSSRYVAEWGGAATKFEEREIRDWTLKNAPGIPQRLAGCFAWHVTADRDQ
jgi:hypothetical protein